MLPDARIRAVQTGACPHTAIRDDISANLDAVEQLEADYPGLELVLVESGGDNLTATFSYGLVHRQIFVIDVAGGDKVPRKGGPGITRSDLLVINKTDLAPLVGADLAVMARDAEAARGDRPTLFTSLAADPAAARRGRLGALGAVRCRGFVIARTTAVVEPDGVLGALSCAAAADAAAGARRRPAAGASCAWSGPRRARWRAMTCRSRCGCGPGPGPRCAPPGPAWPRAGAAAGRRGCRSGPSWAPAPRSWPTRARWSSAPAAGWTCGSSWPWTPGRRCSGGSWSCWAAPGNRPGGPRCGGT